ncbi:hypothetical protein NDU88_004248 [Pleurodeles waltl]|uniref:Uncharacterized protein n=1 Tax=Pleurodeles waltl TaxID=8319 RepID=A0AAV7W4F2_PLEWA|nr:hypothetical protein NDU88_004248 [Pleurodeles waltl]
MANRYSPGPQHIRAEACSSSVAQRSPEVPANSAFQSQILFSLSPKRGLPRFFLGTLGPNRSLDSSADTARRQLLLHPVTFRCLVEGPGARGPDVSVCVFK